MHALLSAHRGRPAHDLLRDLRRQDPLPGPDALRRRPCPGGSLGPRREAAAQPPQLSLFLNPHDPAVREQVRKDGIPDDWLQFASRSPVYALAIKYRIALALHPEYRTLLMVWYVPPFSPVVNALETDGYEANPDEVFPAIETLRISVDYLANLLAAGDSDRIRDVLCRLAAMRAHMRKKEVMGEVDEQLAESVGSDTPGSPA